jgi:monoamine oxidase
MTTMHYMRTWLIVAHCLVVGAQSPQSATCSLYDSIGQRTAYDNNTQPVPGAPSRASARIVIVGAGMAGLAAADDLLNTYGFANVRVLEAGDRVGGRVRSEDTGCELTVGLRMSQCHTDGLLHHGAQYLHNNQNDLYKWAVENNMLAEHAAADTATVLTGRTARPIPSQMSTAFWRVASAETDNLMAMPTTSADADSIGDRTI